MRRSRISKRKTRKEVRRNKEYKKSRKEERMYLERRPKSQEGRKKGTIRREKQQKKKECRTKENKECIKLNITKYTEEKSRTNRTRKYKQSHKDTTILKDVNV